MNKNFSIQKRQAWGFSIAILLFAAPLHAETSSDAHEESINKIIEAHAQIDARSGKSDKETAFQNFILNAYERQYGDREILFYLKNKEPNLNESNRDGWTALHMAARFLNSTMIKEFVKNGASTQKQNLWGETPLMVAVRNFRNPQTDNPFHTFVDTSVIVELIRQDPSTLDIVDDTGASPRSILKDCFEKGSKGDVSSHTCYTLESFQKNERPLRGSREYSRLEKRAFDPEIAKLVLK